MIMYKKILNSILCYILVYVIAISGNINALELCGGPDEECPPSISFDVHLIYYNTTTHRAVFCVTANGSGYSRSYSESFAVQVSYRWHLTDNYTGISGGCSEAVDGGDGACVECSSDCTIYKNDFPPDSTIEFIAVGVQWETWVGTPQIVCKSDTLFKSITIPNNNVDEGFPIEAYATELGVPECDYLIGENPINLTNGNKLLVGNDLFIGNDYGLPINFVRYYNSYTNREGVLGGNWSHSYEYSFETDSLGTITLHTGDGRDIIFTAMDSSGNTIYKPNYGINSKLDIDSTNPNLVNYNFTDQSGFQISFIKDSTSTTWISYFSDIHGNHVTPTYDSNGLITRLTDESRRYITLVYNGSDKLDSIKSIWGAPLIAYKYNATGYLDSVKYANGTWEQYDYEDSTTGNYRNIIKKENSDGFVWNYGYDSDGLSNANYGEDNINRIDWSYITLDTTCPIFYHYDVLYNLDTSTQKSYDATWNHDYDYKVLAQNSDPNCSSCGTEYDYDRNGNKSFIRYKNGSVDSLFYDSRGNLTHELKAANDTSLSQETIIEYHPEFNLPTKIYYPSIISTDVNEWDTLYYFYDSVTALLDSSISYGWSTDSISFSDTTRFEYYSNGQLYKINGPLAGDADIIIYVYYENIPYNWSNFGDLKYIILPNADTTTFSIRDGLGNVDIITDANGFMTKYLQDNRGRVYKIINNAGSSNPDTTTLSLNFKGNVKQITDPIGLIQKYKYDDEHGWLDYIQNPDSEKIDFSYDINSNINKIEFKTSDSTVRKTESAEYDYLSKLLKIYLPNDTDNTEFTYDDMDNISSVIDPEGNVINFEYDALNRLIEFNKIDSTDTLKIIYEYDDHDNITLVKDASDEEYEFVYNDKNLLVSENSNIRGLITYTYDAVGNLTTKTNAKGNTTAYTYDVLNRLETIDYNDNDTVNVTYVYDSDSANGMGRLWKEITDDVTIEYLYDDFGDIRQETQTFGGNSYTTNFEYNYKHNISSITYPSGQTYFYNYNANNYNQIESITWDFDSTSAIDTLIKDIDYEPYGGIKRICYGNGDTTFYEYNNQYQVVQIKSIIGGSVQINLVYQYDLAGNIVQVTDSLNSNNNVAYGYDNLYRLESATSSSYPNGNFTFNYSNNNNRILKEIDSSGTVFSTTYNYTSNKLTSLSGSETASANYDSCGNIVSWIQDGDTTVYVYDDAERLSSVTAGTYLQDYMYNSRHQRYKIDYPSSNDEVFVYDVYGHLLSEYDGSTGNRKGDYIYLYGIPIAKTISNNEIFYYHNNSLGTPLVVTDTNQTTVWSAQYYPFGGIYNEYVSEPSYHRFLGQWEDADTDLYYNWHRFYRPELGQYISPDPIGLAGGINMYSYVGGNPINYIDPDGCFIVSTGLAIYGLFEIGMSLYDAYETYQTLNDKCASKFEKAAVVTAFVGGLFAPGGGYGAGIKKGIGWTGKLGAKALAKEVGGETHRFFRTKFGSRFVDQFANRIAHESKVGKVFLTKQIKKQIMKDANLLSIGSIDNAIWHFYKSPVTGLGGPSSPLRKALQDAGITIIERGL